MTAAVLMHLRRCFTSAEDAIADIEFPKIGKSKEKRIGEA